MILVIGGAYQGKYDFAKNNICSDESKIYNSFHKNAQSYIKQGRTADELVKEIFANGYEVVISDEIGCGIIPVDRFEREWREQTGRALCDIAKACDEVWRVCCGIGTKIKG